LDSGEVAGAGTGTAAATAAAAATEASKVKMAAHPPDRSAAAWRVGKQGEVGVPGRLVVGVLGLLLTGVFGRLYMLRRTATAPVGDLYLTPSSNGVSPSLSFPSEARGHAASTVWTTVAGTLYHMQ
jgi:hypothetical protein